MDGPHTVCRLRPAAPAGISIVFKLEMQITATCTVKRRVYLGRRRKWDGEQGFEPHREASVSTSKRKEVTQACGWRTL